MTAPETGVTLETSATEREQIAADFTAADVTPLLSATGLRLFRDIDSLLAALAAKDGEIADLKVLFNEQLSSNAGHIRELDNALAELARLKASTSEEAETIGIALADSADMLEAMEVQLRTFGTEPTVNASGQRERNLRAFVLSRRLAAQSDGWQPIERAPKDGTKFLARGRAVPDFPRMAWDDQIPRVDDYCVVWWREGWYDADEEVSPGLFKKVRTLGYSYWAPEPQQFSPTHWHPLPAPPSPNKENKTP